jgi:hypothetical protein
MGTLFWEMFMGMESETAEDREPVCLREIWAGGSN